MAAVSNTKFKFAALAVIGLALVFTPITVNGKELCVDPNDDAEALVNGANDVVVVRQASGELRSTPLHVQIGKLHNWRTLFKSREGRKVTLVVNGRPAPVKLTVTDSGYACFSRRTYKFTLTPEEWETFDLKPGGNLAVYKVPSLDVEIRFIVYLLKQDAKLVLTDVDGTITISDVVGKVYPYFGVDADHDGVVELYDKIAKNGYQIIYLTARSMGDDKDTREYLFKTLQNRGGYSLPYGPLFMSPKTLPEAAYEGLTDPAPQKTETMHQILKLFEFGPQLVEAAYGNKESDTRAYLAAGVPRDRIYVVNTDSELHNVASMGQQQASSYGLEADAVDQKFPKIDSDGGPEYEDGSIHFG